MLIIGGNTKEINKIGHAERVVSLVPSLTETIVSFGAKNRLAGITRFCKYPEDILREVEIVGGPKDFDTEKVLLVYGEMFRDCNP